MIPSRGPLQVRLEDTGGPRLQCKPPVQVKILRRPQPVSSATNQTNAVATAHKLDGFAESPFDDDDDVTTDEFSPTNSSSYVSEQQNGTLRPGPLNYSTVAATSIRKIIDSDSSAQISTKSGALDRTKSDKRASNNRSAATMTATTNAVGSGGVSTNNKKPLKTYQERADEYAKARLRILGSAFPENEDLSAPNDDDVNRI